jgi:hypothetical protein
MLSGRDEGSPEAYSPDTANGYASENDAFSFCLVNTRFEKNNTNAAWKFYGSGPLNSKLP